MTAIFIKPDKQYGLGTVNVRFAVDHDAPWDAVIRAAVPHIKKAGEQFEKQSGWRWVHQDKVQITKSHLQMDPNDADGHARDRSLRVKKHGKVDYVAVLTFERPLDWVDPDEEKELAAFRAEGAAEGFIGDDELDPRYKFLLEHPEDAQGANNANHK